MNTLRSPAPASSPSSRPWTAKRDPLLSPAHPSSSPANSPNTMSRKNSNTFKYVSKGGLVSNSPFMTGNSPSNNNNNNNSTSSSNSSAAGKALLNLGKGRPELNLDGAGVRDDQSQNRKLSGELVGPSSSSPVASSSGSAANISSQSSSTSPLQPRTITSNSSPFKPTRPPLPSPATQSASRIPLYTTAQNAPLSPPLPQAPTSIPSLRAETAPFVTAPSNVGLGAPISLVERGERRVVGGVTPVIPGGVLASPKRLKGPRAPTDDDEDGDGLDDSASRVLRHKASTKTVTWATEEEVLEFDDDLRRESMASSSYSGAGSSDGDVSLGSSEEGYGEEEEETGSRRISLGEEMSNMGAEGDSSFGLEEGGSLVLREDYELDDQDDEGSAIQEIDQFLSEDVFQFRQLSRSLGGNGETSSVRAPTASSSRFSDYSASNYSTVSTSVTPTTEYLPLSLTNSRDHAQHGDEEEMLDSESSYSSRSSSPTPLSGQHQVDPQQPTFTLLPPSETGFSLPDIPESSPFMGFSNTSSSDVGSDLVLTPQSPATPMLPQIQEIAPLFSSPPSSVVSTADSGTGSINRFAMSRQRMQERIRKEDQVLGSFGLLSSPTLSSSSASTIGPSSAIFSKASSTPSTVATRATVESPTKSLPPALESDLFSPASSSMNLGSFPNPPLPDYTSSLTLDPPPALPPHLTSEGGRKTSILSLQPEEDEEDADRVETVRFPSRLMKVPSRDGDVGSPLDQLQNGWRKKGRRSLSTGDVVAPTALEMEKGYTMPEFGAAPITSSSEMEKNFTMPEFGRNSLELAGGFAMGLQSSLDTIYRKSSNNYNVSRVVYAKDGGGVGTVGSAGDVDPGRAWRKKRPSEMHIASTYSTNSIKKMKDPLSGHVYVSNIILELENVPIPSGGDTKLEVWLDNGSKHVHFPQPYNLARKVVIGKEWDLVSSTNLAIDIEFIIPSSTSTNAHLLRPSSPPPSSSSSRLLVPPTTPTKSPGKFLAGLFNSPKSPKVHGRSRSESSKTLLFGSPRKASAPVPALPPPPMPNRLADFLAPDSGMLGRATIRFAEQAAKCRGRKVEIKVPLQPSKTGGGVQPVRGFITCNLVYLPHIPNLSKSEHMPKSSEEVVQGLWLAEKAGLVLYQGVLTQLGGDCTSWRRRNFRAFGRGELVAYSEVTKKATVEIRLSSATSIIDPDEAPTSPGAKSPGKTGESSSIGGGLLRASSSIGDLDDDDMTVNKHAFRLVFESGESYSFFADNAEEKARWIEVLRRLIGRKELTPPEWAKAFRRMKVLSAGPASASTEKSS